MLIRSNFKNQNKVIIKSKRWTSYFISISMKYT